MSFDFSPAGYQRLLQALSDHGYQTLTFSTLLRPATAGACVLRHDVDASLGLARHLAELEASRGVRATYFVLLRSPLYNLLSRDGTTQLRHLASLGHELGLHYDSRDGDHGGDIEGRIARDLALLSDVAGTPVTAFSFHQPTAELLSQRVAVPSAINAYTLDESGYQYVSDSNRNWRGSDLPALIEQRRPLQLLLHPMWWVCGEADVHDCWDAALRQNLERQQQHLLATEGAYGPARQFHIVRTGSAEGEATAAAAPRCHLAPLTDADVPVLFSWINDRALAVLSAPFHPVHQADHEAWFREIRSRGDVAIFGIRRAADNQLVGTCQLSAIDLVHRSAELRIRIGVPDARGGGIGTDACRALLEHAFDDLNLSRVYLHVLDSNAAARRLYAKVGFELEGISRQAVFIDGRWQDVVLMARRRPDRLNRSTADGR